ncbi:hypothetical protein GCM10020219_017210 [Nonomuraea dietziae]
MRTPRYTRYATPAHFTTPNSVADWAIRNDSPPAAATMCTRVPASTPNALASPRCPALGQPAGGDVEVVGPRDEDQRERGGEEEEHRATVGRVWSWYGVQCAVTFPVQSECRPVMA